MFRDIYKKAVDDVKPTDGLLEKILSEKNAKPKRNFKKITAYATLTAAVAVIAMSAAVYPGLSDLYKQRRAEDTAAIQDTDLQTEQKMADSKISDTADLHEYKSKEVVLQYGEAENGKKNRNSEAAASDMVADSEAGAAAEAEEESFLKMTDTDDTAAPEYDENIMAVNGYEVDLEPADKGIQTDETALEDRTEAPSFDSGGGSSAAASGGGSAKNAVSDEFDYSSVFHENARVSGFSNIGGKAVYDSETALLFAKNEVSADGEIYVSHDEDAGVWRVCFHTETEIIYVYIDDSGATLMIACENV